MCMAFQMAITTELFNLLYRLFGFMQFSLKSNAPMRQIGAVLIHVPLVLTFFLFVYISFKQFDYTFYPASTNVVILSDFICLCANALAMALRTVYYFIKRKRIRTLMRQVWKLQYMDDHIFEFSVSLITAGISQKWRFKWF